MDVWQLYLDKHTGQPPRNAFDLVNFSRSTRSPLNFKDAKQLYLAKKEEISVDVNGMSSSDDEPAILFSPKIRLRKASSRRRLPKAKHTKSASKMSFHSARSLYRPDSRDRERESDSRSDVVSDSDKLSDPDADDASNCLPPTHLSPTISQTHSNIHQRTQHARTKSQSKAHQRHHSDHASHRLRPAKHSRAKSLRIKLDQAPRHSRRPMSRTPETFRCAPAPAPVVHVPATNRSLGRSLSAQPGSMLTGRSKHSRAVSNGHAHGQALPRRRSRKRKRRTFKVGDVVSVSLKISAGGVGADGQGKSQQTDLAKIRYHGGTGTRRDGALMYGVEYFKVHLNATAASTGRRACSP